MKLDEIKKTETCLGHECLEATFSFPHPASKYDPTEKRRNYVFFEAVKTGVEETEIRIRFNRFEMGLLDVRLMMLNDTLERALRNNRFANYMPLIPSYYEKCIIADFKHKEKNAPNNEEPQTEEEDEE